MSAVLAWPLAPVIVSWPDMLAVPGIDVGVLSRFPVTTVEPYPRLQP
jgi:hypothetical protein